MTGGSSLSLAQSSKQPCANLPHIYPLAPIKLTTAYHTPLALLLPQLTPSSMLQQSRNRILFIAAVFAFTVVCINLPTFSVFRTVRVPEWLVRNPPKSSVGGRHQDLAVSPVVREALDGSWKEGMTIESFNAHFRQILRSCRTGGPCHKRQSRLVLLGWGHFGGVLKGVMQGESIWCDAMMDVIHALGYSMLFASSTTELEDMYREYYQHVQVVLWEGSPWHSRPCLKNSTCVYVDTQSPKPIPPPNSTHLNIPIWKIFNCNWWNDASPPLGGPFTLSPENYRIWPGDTSGHDNYFIGYSVEKTCLKTHLVSYDERPRQAYVFAKYLRYFLRPEYFLPSITGDNLSQTQTDFFSSLSATANLTFVGQFKRDGTPPNISPPPGIHEVPRMERLAFQKVVASSRVLLGIGLPGLSPTPYEALCLGVPFINPVEQWDKKDPEDRSKWKAQHDGLLYAGVDEPYVYHVKVGDREGFERAIVKAMETPITRYIPKDMEMSALVRRIKTLLETDWKPVAQRRMQDTDFQLDQ